MALIPQTDIECLPKQGWQYKAAQDLLEVLSQPTSFPCFFSQNAHRRKLIQFAFVERNDSAAHILAMEDVLEYIARARKWDGDIARAEPLVMQFEPESHGGADPEHYHQLGWEVLQTWHENDPAAWPEGVAKTPDSPFWSMCLDGMQLFVNMSCPAHMIRRSRNLGRAMTFVVNPRERFDIVAGDNPRGRRIREQIRSRIIAYDGIEHCPTLGSYEAGDIEWWQYGLPEKNQIPTESCPFRMRASDRSKTPILKVN